MGHSEKRSLIKLNCIGFEIFGLLRSYRDGTFIMGNEYNS